MATQPPTVRALRRGTFFLKVEDLGKDTIPIFVVLDDEGTCGTTAGGLHGPLDPNTPVQVLTVGETMATYGFQIAQRTEPDYYSEG